MAIERYTYLENRKVLADSGESLTDINVIDPITALYFEMRAQNGATSNKAATVADVITEVSIIDGSRVLLSLTGYQLAALMWHEHGSIPYNLISESAGGYQNLYVPIRFGRWIGDPLYSFNPKAFNNPQIRVKWNLAAVRAVGATGFVTATGRLSIIAHVVETAPDPVGMLTHKQHYAWSTAASGVESIELPTDNPIRNLLIRSWVAASGSLAGISNVKLTIDQGKHVPIDMSATDYKRMQSLGYPPFNYKHIFKAKNGDTLYALLKQDETLNLTGYDNDITLAYTNDGIGQGTMGAYIAGAADTTERDRFAIVSGWNPFGAVYMPFGDPRLPDSWLPAPNYRSIRLELTQSAAGAAASVAVTQEYRY